MDDEVTSVGARAPFRDDDLVSILMVTYNPEAQSLRECFNSVASQTHCNLELIVVDNGSTRPTGSHSLERLVDHLQQSLPTRLYRLKTNTGFSHAMNVAIESSAGGLCLLLNPDTTLDSRAIEVLVRHSSEHPDVLGFAPKIKLLAYPAVIDSVGVEFSWSGDASQRGLGQIDLGQFDSPEPVMGITMSAALVRRKAFRNEEVGLLDERYFMFFEDVDWSLRAGLYGYDFRTAPDALVLHAGSQSARQKAFSWRYRMIERNVYFTAIKNFERRHLMGFLLRRSWPHLRNLHRGVRVVPTVRILAESAVALVALRQSRAAVQHRRCRKDSDLTHATVASPGMDLEAWRPIYSWRMVRESLGRLYVAQGDERWSRAYRYLDALASFDVDVTPSDVLARLERIAGPIPTAIRDYVTHMSER